MGFSKRTATAIGMLLFSILCLAQNSATLVSGTVLDQDGSPVQRATVWLKGTNKGTTTDNNGRFSFAVRLEGMDTLQFSSIGYSDTRVRLTPQTRYPIKIILRQTDYSIDEVIIRPKREKYSKRENPAVDLIREIIERRKQDDPMNREFVSRSRYERLSFTLDNFTNNKLESAPFARFHFLEEYIDTLEATGNPALTVSSTETVAAEYFQRRPSKERKVIKSKRRAGIEDFIPSNEIQGSIDATVRDIDLFKDGIILMHKEFTSPFASYAPSFYRYYISDTVTIGGEQCIDLTFVPNNAESLGFNGHIFVTANGSHSLKRVIMNLSPKANLNFVNSMTVEQDFDGDSTNPRLLLRERLMIMLALTDNSDGLFCDREVFYSAYRFDEDVDRSPFDRETRIVDESDANNWENGFRTVYGSNGTGTAVSSNHADVAQMLDRLRQIPLYYWTEQIVNVLFSGYFPIREENTPVYIGPVNTWMSYNGLEGIRLKFGGMTTAALNNRLFATGYLIYGTADRRFKYFGRLEYSFKPKKEQWNEFPIRSLRLQYEDDIYQYGQQYAYTNKDNAFLSLKRRADNMSGYINKVELTYTNERYSGLSFTATARNRTNESTGFIPMVLNDGSGNCVDKITQSELELGLRYAPHEEFNQYKWNRGNRTPQHPIFTLSHSMSRKGLFGSDYSIQHTEFSYRQRLMAGPLGSFNVMLKAGRIWGQAPYPLLIMPDANLSYTYRKESFETMTPMEFIMDKHLTWDVVYNMNGLLLNRTPIIKRLQLRELLFFRGTWGGLDDRNNPDLTSDRNIFAFPREYSPAVGTMMNGKPFIEVGAGLSNIFKIMSVQAFRRVTYRDTPDGDLWGVRIEVGLDY